jgi:multicomponent Na+:H+ antiporter subunit D
MKPLALFIIIPLATAFLIALLGRRIKNLGDVLTNMAGAGLFILACSIIPGVISHKVLTYKTGNWPVILGSSFIVDGLSMLLLVVINLVCCLVMVYSLSYMEKYTDKWNYQALFMLMIAGLNGVILSADIFTLYVFLELASIAGYVLVAFSTEAEALEASFRYTIIGSLASVCILLGIALLYSFTSTLNMADISLIIASRSQQGQLLNFVSVLFLAGFGMKAALVPFHAWLPDAHSSAPSPVSATLSGVVIKTLGVYSLIRIFFNVIGTSSNLLNCLVILGLASMIAGAFLAIAQNDIKRMFAYSSISQVGYIIFALGIGTPLAVLGGLFHLLNHAVFKSLLFLNAGAIERVAGTRDLTKLKGLAEKLPLTSSTALFGSMSISGVPPFAGFWSKLIIIIAAIEAGHPIFALIAALVSIVTLVYYLKFQAGVFFGTLPSAFANIKEAPLTMKMPMVVLAVLSVAGGLLLLPCCREFLQSAVKAVLS